MPSVATCRDEADAENPHFQARRMNGRIVDMSLQPPGSGPFRPVDTARVVACVTAAKNEGSVSR